MEPCKLYAGNKKVRTKVASTKSRSGAEAGPRIGLIPGLMEAEKRTILVLDDAAAAMNKILKGAAAGTSASDAVIAATLSAMTGAAPKITQKSKPVEMEVTLPKPIWAYQIALAEKSGCSLSEVHEQLLKAYIGTKKPRQ